MKVKIQFTLEVEAEEWAKEYGIDVHEVREDVKNYFANGDIIPLHLEGIVKFK